MQTLEQLRRGELVGARELKLSCGLTHFPEDIYKLVETLEILDLSGNYLTELPSDLPRFKKLKIIFCSNNLFDELPEVLGGCAALSMIGFKANQIKTLKSQALPKTLRWLILTDNHIEEIPAEIGRCGALQKLMLAGNCLSKLPESMANCHRLELLRLSANQFFELPEWLLSMPRLTWLAYNGNPMTAKSENQALARAEVPSIDWRELRMEEKLGEGASGVIYRATHKNVDAWQSIAIKVFKGKVTSDGKPESEMAACLSLEKHANLTEVMGKVLCHPEQAQALALSLISDDYVNLAGPPSFESCTRDVYRADLRFERRMIIKVLREIASAVSHLHRQGVMHGDLYAHNILLSNEGHAILGDFGAASLFDPLGKHAQALQKLEVRAFGCLLEELLSLCDFAKEDGALNPVRDLKDACLHLNPALRPTFEQIQVTLSGVIEDCHAQ